MNYFTKAKPYNSLNEYNLKKYGKKIAKINLNGGFTCPNRDGLKGVGGCTFCGKLGAGEFAGDKTKSITEQFNEIKDVMDNKWKDLLYMPYFQAYSNTYSSIENLDKLYKEALNVIPEKTFGISIATRGDCIDEKIGAYLGELNKKTHVQVELGLQTSNEKTSIRINRCMTNLEFINAVNILRKYNIEIVVHIINGLPGETIEDNLKTIDFINKLDVQGIKFHSLLLIKDTYMYLEYQKEPFHILTQDEYVKIVCEQICHMRSDIIIHRLSADTKIDDLIMPKWTIKKMTVMNDIDKYLRNNNLYQGIKYKGGN
ncbi:MAG: TIGR01212 family radical SAM protein [Acholeplasmatales bacterium]|nr:TIGR01212 family radical SAM protein [Acholeplasmatales bacterium]